MAHEQPTASSQKQNNGTRRAPRSVCEHRTHGFPEKLSCSMPSVTHARRLKRSPIYVTSLSKYPSVCEKRQPSPTAHSAPHQTSTLRPNGPKLLNLQLRPAPCLAVSSLPRNTLCGETTSVGPQPTSAPRLATCGSQSTALHATCRH